jgi:DNA-binding NarL/FixJ family response regulator
VATYGDVGRLAAAGRWAEVELALSDVEELDAAQLELLAEARWWSGKVDDTIALWESAHRLARTAGDTVAATRLAAWIALEYHALGNPAAASGWAARADAIADGSSSGWLALARAVTDPDPRDQASGAQEAVDLARRSGDADLEISALTRLGVARVRAGELGAGLVSIDAGMAAATAGDATRLRTVGEACCDLVLVTELTGDVERLGRWMSVVQDFVERRGYPDVMGFCATCCAETEALHGDFGGVEQQLRAAVVGLHETGHAARCVPPAAKLAELLVLQGRLEEAEPIVGSDEDSDSLLVRARLALAKDDAALATTLASRVSRRIGGDPLVRVAALSVSVDAHLAIDDLAGAAEEVGRLRTLANGTTSARARARAAIGEGRLALATGDGAEAAGRFEAALDELAGVQGSIEGADAHLALAHARRDTAPDVARAEARAALRAFEAVGASSGVDAAAALLRSLGDRSRVGEKGVGQLTQREWEVLRLVALGLSNAEIGDRLYISTKTAGNHVSSILSKLGLRSRAEAASYAVLHPTRS